MADEISDPNAWRKPLFQSFTEDWCLCIGTILGAGQTVSGLAIEMTNRGEKGRSFCSACCLHTICCNGFNRRHMRLQYGIQGSMAEDIALSTVCGPCVSTQMFQEAKSRTIAATQSYQASLLDDKRD
mmetsp:Transcript_2874/g.3049  ORF Transcript_2874/g.3049 Transcript_2874/m.3049 type:complete len:127 (+) Transcript_2874:112-492(+)